MNPFVLASGDDAYGYLGRAFKAVVGAYAAVVLLLDASGAPVSTLANVTLTVANLTCSSSTTPDAIEEYASGSSSLQNLGDGYCQFNWKAPTIYADSCKTLRLDMSEGIFRTAAFQFTK